MARVLCLPQKKNAVNLWAPWESHVSGSRTQWPLLKLVLFAFCWCFLFSVQIALIIIPYLTFFFFFLMDDIMCVRIHLLKWG